MRQQGSRKNNLKGYIFRSLKVIITLQLRDSVSVSTVAAMMVQMYKENKIHLTYVLNQL